MITLENVIISSLLSEGEIILSVDNTYKLQTPFKSSKWEFVSKYLDTEEMKYCTYNTIKQQLEVTHLSLETFYNLWYQDNIKIFSNRVNTSFLTIDNITLFIVLYGERKLEHIMIETSVKKEHQLVLCHSLSIVLKTAIVPGNFSVKILDITRFIVQIVQKQPLYYSSELLRFLFPNELKNIQFEKREKDYDY